ncbi:hypothetical protein KHA80_23050 [Anaerobacillus sp. HL2]|nr:hypothetical protein KHA80_23050 [Anaerobacillus sp. HL2]
MLKYQKTKYRLGLTAPIVKMTLSIEMSCCWSNGLSNNRRRFSSRKSNN